MFTGEDLDDGMDFESDHGEGEDKKRGDDEGGGGIGSPFLALAKMTGE